MNSRPQNPGSPQLLDPTVIVETLAELLSRREIAAADVLAVSSSNNLSTTLRLGWFGTQVLPALELATAWGAVNANSDLAAIVFADLDDIVGDPLLLSEVASSQSLIIIMATRYSANRQDSRRLPTTTFWQSLGVPFLGRMANNDLVNLGQILTAAIAYPRLAIIEILDQPLNDHTGDNVELGIIHDHAPSRQQPSRRQTALVDQPDPQIDFNNLIRTLDQSA